QQDRTTTNGPSTASLPETSAADRVARQLQASQVEGLLIGGPDAIPFDRDNPIVQSYSKEQLLRLAGAKTDLGKARLVTNELRKRGHQHKSDDGGGDTCETMANIIVDHLQAFGVDTARVTQESESPRATDRKSTRLNSSHVK